MSTHIAQTFGTGPDQKRGYCGHPEIELALMKLYRLTGDQKHLDLAAYFINERGQQPPHYFDVEKAERERRGLFEQRYTTPTTNTASRTSRCASRTRSSATRCAPCTSTPRMADLAFETRRSGAEGGAARRCGTT